MELMELNATEHRSVWATFTENVTITWTHGANAPQLSLKKGDELRFYPDNRSIRKNGELIELPVGCFTYNKKDLHPCCKCKYFSISSKELQCAVNPISCAAKKVCSSFEEEDDSTELKHDDSVTVYHAVIHYCTHL